MFIRKSVAINVISALSGLSAVVSGLWLLFLGDIFVKTRPHQPDVAGGFVYYVKCLNGIAYISESEISKYNNIITIFAASIVIFILAAVGGAINTKGKSTELAS